MIAEITSKIFRNKWNLLFLSGVQKEKPLRSNNAFLTKQIIDLKQRTHIILPIVIALILPGVRFVINPAVVFQNTLDDYLFWGTASFIIHNFWHVFWLLWDIRTQYANPRFLGKLLLCVLGSAGISILIGTFHIWGVEFSDFKGMVMAVFLFLIIQYTLRSQLNIAKLQLEKEQILTENFKTQLKVLHAKIDPHFLFNSMNTLRSMVRQSHENSEKFILNLSDFYRQTLKYNQKVQLKVSEEIELLESYIFLMKSRNEEAVFIEIDIDESVQSYSLPTLALQIVVENCFKHNSLTASNPLHIDINHTGDGYIEVTNNLQPKIQQEESTGNGLELLIKRYELMHIKRGVIVNQSENQFSVKLKLIA